MARLWADATTLEANAALRSIVRRDTGESYQDFLTKLAQASGIETPTRAGLARMDRKRKNKGSNDDWTHTHDPDAKITKMKDGRTHLAHKAEHVVDLETGAIVGVTVQDADEGDTTTSRETLIEAAEQVEAVQPDGNGIEEVVGDKGYHSNQSLVDLEAVGVRSYISEPDRGRRNWKNHPRCALRCTAIVGAFAAHAACVCCGFAVSAWNDPSRISTRPAGCAVCTCAATRTSASGC
jgi:transposase